MLAVTLAEPAPMPHPAPGALVLAGGGRLPDAVGREFVRLAGGADAVIVVIPTASEFADDPAEADSFVRNWKSLGAGRVSLLHTRDRKVADTAAFCAPLANATGVWLSGGDQSRLTAAYRGTRVHRELAAVAGRGGVVGGTSAGCAALSDPMIAGGRTAAELAPGLGGLGLLERVVTDQHFTHRARLPRLRDAVARSPGFAGVGVDESTALVVRAGVGTVLGDGAVTVLRPGKPDEVLRAGGSVALGSAGGK